MDWNITEGVCYQCESKKTVLKEISMCRDCIISMIEKKTNLKESLTCLSCKKEIEGLNIQCGKCMHYFHRYCWNKIGGCSCL